MRCVCPLCYEDHDAPPSAAGTSITCRCCGASFVLPLVAAAPVTVSAPPQAPPLVVTYSPEMHWDAPPPDEEREEDEEERDRRALHLRRMRQAKERRAKWTLLIKFSVVVVLGVAAVIAVSAARERLAEAGRQKEATKGQPRR